MSINHLSISKRYKVSTFTPINWARIFTEGTTTGWRRTFLSIRCRTLTTRIFFYKAIDASYVQGSFSWNIAIDKDRMKISVIGNFSTSPSIWACRTKSTNLSIHRHVAITCRHWKCAYLKSDEKHLSCMTRRYIESMNMRSTCVCQWSRSGYAHRFANDDMPIFSQHDVRWRYLTVLSLKIKVRTPKESLFATMLSSVIAERERERERSRSAESFPVRLERVRRTRVATHELEKRTHLMLLVMVMSQVQQLVRSRFQFDEWKIFS
jgi:hypothetical protein